MVKGGRRRATGHEKTMGRSLLNFMGLKSRVKQSVSINCHRNGEQY